MNKKKAKSEQKLSDEDVEHIFENTWKNWASRRRCEQTHIPKFAKEENKKENHNL